VYEVRGTDLKRMYASVLNVLDKSGDRMNVLQRETIGEMERFTFEIKATRKKHHCLISELRASDPVDQVLAFRDTEEE
jgi:putative Mg2+ transporter-C (MgtC) family protein